MKLKTAGFILSLIIVSGNIFAQNKVNIYNPEANARADIEKAVSLAAENNKHVLIQIGGNWCSWCVLLHNFMHNDAKLDSLLNADYVFVTLNYSKENKNEEILEELGFPHRFGFPVLVILNAQGQRIHTQNTVYLEEGNAYNQKKVYGFLMDWRPNAINKSSYTK
jgi:thioredoxin-related protein